MFYVFIAILLLAVAIPIVVESKAHPNENVLIGLRKAASDLIWGAVALAVLTFALVKLAPMTLHFLFRHLHL